MALDLLVKNGRIIDGSGAPAFSGDVAVKYGKIVEVGKLSGTASRTIDADGEVLIEQGEHTGAAPGRVLRNALYRNGR